MSAPPYFNPNVFEKMTWRNDDVIVNCPAKSGTHWGMWITYHVRNAHRFQTAEECAAFIRSKGSLYVLTPWLEFIYYPEQSSEEVYELFNALPSPRTFKSHMPTPPAPNPEQGVKQVIIMRNVKDVTSSIYPFFNNHTDEFKALWGFPPPLNTFEEAVDFICKSQMIWNFCKAWWPYRHHENVLLLHFSDMSASPQKLREAVKKIVNFLNVELSEKRLMQIVEISQFSKMKEYDDVISKLWCGKKGDVSALKNATMMRKGKTDDAEDNQLWTDELLEKFNNAEKESLKDFPELSKWLKSGGKFK